MQTEILLVDDDHKVLEILEESLGRKGYRVSKASSGRQALATCENRSPELVILDMVLPDMNGMELMGRMHNGVGTDKPPVLILSADDNVSTRLEVLNRGAEDYLVKPVSLRELNAKVESVLRRSSQQRELKKNQESLESQISQGREYYSKINKELKRQLLSMRTLFNVSQDLNRVLDSEELVSVVSLTLLGELQISSMAMFSLERENADQFDVLGVKGFSADKFQGLSIERTSEFVEHLEEDARPRKIARNPDRSWTKMLPDLRLAMFEYVTPIVVKGETKGLIFTGPKLTGDDYSDYDVDMMMFIANSAGIGMENARLLKQLQVTYVSTLKTLISIIEAKDPYTKGHTERVAAYALAVANRLGANEETARRIMFGALLHDIGKLGVLESVLHKDGKLDENEWQLLKSHPEVGAGIVEKMEFLTGVAEIVRHHHESWDGRGYPSGIKGEDIPLGARIVTVVDAFDAMTTDRSYRKAMSVEEALSRLKNGAGTQFDPRVVKEFTRYIRRKGSQMVVAGLDANL